MTNILIFIVIALGIFYIFRGNNTKERELERFLFFWVIVPPGYEYVRLRFGVPYKKSVLKEGYHILIPGIYSIDKKVNVKVQILHLKSKPFWLADQVEGILDYSMEIEITDIIKHCYAHEEPMKAINDYAIDSVKSILSQITTTEATQSINSVDNKFKEELEKIQEKAKECGIKIYDIKAKDINFGEQFEKSLEKKRIAENEAEAIITEANAVAKARTSKAASLIQLAKEMELEMTEDLYFKILQACYTTDAIESGVDTMFLGESGVASPLITAKKILDRG